MIVWNAQNFALLKDGLEVAEQLGLDMFAVRFSFTERAEFTVAEARGKIDELTPIFRQPPKVYPPNKEGPEP